MLVVGGWLAGDADVADDGDAVTVVVTTEALGPAVVHAVSSIPSTASAATAPTIRSLTIAGYRAFLKDY
jgi:hypothetical protein